VAQWARKSAPRFQVGLLGWIKRRTRAESRSARTHRRASWSRPRRRSRCSSCGGSSVPLLEALREKGLEESVSVKRLLGLADREMRGLYEVGEARYSAVPPVELLNNLLYYVARASSHRAARRRRCAASFRLGELLPVDDRLSKARDTCRRPVKLMQTVAAAIREDLARSRTRSISSCARARSGRASSVRSSRCCARSATRSACSASASCAAACSPRSPRLEDIVAERARSTTTAIEIATTLIGIEDGLDEQLHAADRAGRGETPAGQSQRRTRATKDFLHVQSAVLRECIVNLARIKEAIAQNVGGTQDAAGFDLARADARHHRGPADARQDARRR
jgi:chemosensory pili system protein ChpA (sensor histidine kinase/response regulator)